METVLRMTALCVTGCVLAQLLKKEVPALQLLLVLGITAVLLTAAAKMAEGVGAVLGELAERAGIASEYLGIVAKCAGIAAVSRIGGDLCRDAGQSALSSLIELFATLAAAVLMLPLMKTVLDAVLETM